MRGTLCAPQDGLKLEMEYEKEFYKYYFTDVDYCRLHLHRCQS
jgi:hypothetical protein